MRGLIIKDFLVTKKIIKPINYVLIIAAVLALLVYLKQEGVLYVSIFLPMILVGIPKTLMIYDEKCKWDKYAIALPTTRKAIVCSRYIFFFIIIILATGIAALISMIAFTAFNDIVFENYLIAVLAGFVLAILYGMITIPAGYSMGSNGGPFAMIIVTFFFMGIFYLLKQSNIDLGALSDFLRGNILAVSVILLLLFCAASYKASLYFYTKRYS